MSRSKGRIMSKLDQPNDNWFIWVGGPQPVSDHTAVSVRLRKGVVKHKPACHFIWTHNNSENDIVEYCIPSKECPINLDKTPDLCSAGSCAKCLEARSTSNSGTVKKTAIIQNNIQPEPEVHQYAPSAFFRVISSTRPEVEVGTVLILMHSHYSGYGFLNLTDGETFFFSTNTRSGATFLLDDIEQRTHLQLEHIKSITIN